MSSKKNSKVEMKIEALENTVKLFLNRVNELDNSIEKEQQIKACAEFKVESKDFEGKVREAKKGARCPITKETCMVDACASWNVTMSDSFQTRSVTVQCMCFKEELRMEKIHKIHGLGSTLGSQENMAMIRR